MKKHNTPYFVRQQVIPQKVKKPNLVKQNASQEAIELERAQSKQRKQKLDPLCFLWIGEYDIGW